GLFESLPFSHLSSSLLSGLVPSSVPGELRLRATMSAENAPTVLGSARVSLKVSDPARLYYDHAEVHRDQVTASRLIDALGITTDGMEVGDLDPDEWGYVVVYFRTAGRDQVGDPQSCDRGLLLAGDPFEIAASIRNDQRIALRDVTLHVYVETLPDEIRMTKWLTSSGGEIQRSVCRFAARDLTLRYQDAYVYTDMLTRASRDASRLLSSGMLIGDVPAGTERYVRIRYEVVPSTNSEERNAYCSCTTADGRTQTPTLNR
ncbi:MAG: hypothetical protein ABI779_08470, partial [Acidobacteriota bacterium]